MCETSVKKAKFRDEMNKKLRPLVNNKFDNRRQKRKRHTLKCKKIGLRRPRNALQKRILEVGWELKQSVVKKRYQAIETASKYQSKTKAELLNCSESLLAYRNFKVGPLARYLYYIIHNFYNIHFNLRLFKSSWNKLK